MVARTKAALATATLQLLKVVGADGSTDSADSAYVEARYDELREELQDKGLAYWPNTTRVAQEIPGVVFQALTMMLAGRIAAAFGKDEPAVTDDDGPPLPASAKGWRDIKRHMAKRTAGESVVFVDF